MSIPDSSAINEGFVSLIEGADDSVDPILLKDSKFNRGMNVSSRGGLLRTRPGFSKLSSLVDGNFNGAYPYRMNSTDRILTVVAGGLYATRLDDLSVESHGVRFLKNSRCYFVKADKFCIIQDNNSQPTILNEGSVYDEFIINSDGSLSTSKYAQLFPIGTLMAYGHGRIFEVAKYAYDSNGNATAEDGRPYFIAGDLMKTFRPQDCLRWTENIYFNGGGGFGMPAEFGFIYGLAFVNNSHTSQDIGPLMVFARDGIAAFSIDSARSQWLDFDLSKVLFSNSGTQSPLSIVPVNDDLIYRGRDGIRTIRHTSSNAASGSGILSNVPISTEMQYITDLDGESDLPFISGAYVNNRILMTSGGRDSDGAFKAVICLDVNTSSQIVAQASIPAYNGIWTGLRFLQVMQARYNNAEKLFIIAKTDNNGNEIWYLDEDATDDNGTPIKCRTYTKTYLFQDPKSKKRFKWCDLWLQDIVGDVSLRCYYRPHGQKLWAVTNSQTLKADSSGLPQTRYRVRLSTEGEASDLATLDSTDCSNAFQFCLEWEGCMAIKECVFTCHLEPTPDSPVGTDEVSIKLEASDFQYDLNDIGAYAA